MGASLRQQLFLRVMSGQQAQEAQQSREPGSAILRVVCQRLQLLRESALDSGLEHIELDGPLLPLCPAPHANTLGSIVAPRMNAR